MNASCQYTDSSLLYFVLPQTSLVHALVGDDFSETVAPTVYALATRGLLATPALTITLAFAAGSTCAS